MQYMDRYRRLVAESAPFDFSGRLESLKRYEEGESVPSLIRPPDDPKLGYYGFYLDSCMYYEMAVIASHLGIDERPDPVSDTRQVVRLSLQAYTGEW